MAERGKNRACVLTMASCHECSAVLSFGGGRDDDIDDSAEGEKCAVDNGGVVQGAEVANGSRYRARFGA